MTNTPQKYVLFNIITVVYVKINEKRYFINIAV